MADPNDPHAWLTELNSRRPPPRGPGPAAATAATAAAELSPIATPQASKNILEGFNLHNRLLKLEAMVGKLTETIEKQGGTNG